MAELCIQSKYALLLENHVTGVGPSGAFASLEAMRGQSDNPSVIKEENEVPCGACDGAQETAVLTEFWNN